MSVSLWTSATEKEICGERMKIKELKDLLNTIIPSDDVLVTSVVKVVIDGKDYEVEGVTYNHTLFETEGENLMLYGRVKE